MMALSRSRQARSKIDVSVRIESKTSSTMKGPPFSKKSAIAESVV
jgi:hypothetical protein